MATTNNSYDGCGGGVEANEKSLSKEARGGLEVRSTLQGQVVVDVGEMVGRCRLSRFGGWLRLFQYVCVL